MKELTTAHKILMCLTVFILVNICIFVSRDRHVNLLTFSKSFNLFNNASKQRNKTMTLSTLLVNSTPNTVLSGGHTFNSFCKLYTSGGVNGCTTEFQGYYEQYSKRCSAVTPKTNQPLCDCFPKTLIGWEKQEVSMPVKNMSKYKLDAQALGIEPGGHWRPTNCEPRERLAIIVPYRNRPDHVAILVSRLHQLLQRQQNEYQIFIIEQNKPAVFSRSSLMNIGFLDANKTSKFDCYIFTDVDLLPEDDRNMYSCFFSPLHLGGYVSKFKYKVLYDTIFGGISAISHEHVEKTNLFSDRFFGWGGEDDDMFHRLMSAGLTMYRYPRDIGRVYMITHKRDPSNRSNPVKGDSSNYYAREVYLNNGVRQTNYEVVKKENLPLMTKVTVNILPSPPTEDCLIKKGINGSSNEYLSCWGDKYFLNGKIFCCKTSPSFTPECCHKIAKRARMGKKQIRLVNKG